METKVEMLKRNLKDCVTFASKMKNNTKYNKEYWGGKVIAYEEVERLIDEIDKFFDKN